jgi:hypothetical protein
LQGCFSEFFRKALSVGARVLPAGSAVLAQPHCMGLFLRFRLHGVIPRNSPLLGAAMATQLSEERPKCARQPEVSGFAIRLRSRRRGHVRSFLCHLVSPFSRAGCALHGKNDGSSTEREGARDGARDAVRRASRGAAKSAARSVTCAAPDGTTRVRGALWRARYNRAPSAPHLLRCGNVLFRRCSVAAYRCLCLRGVSRRRAWFCDHQT